MTKQLTMVVNAPIPLEAQPMMNCCIVLVTFIVIGEAGSKMGSDETKLRICIVEPYSDSTLVACHTGQTRLFDASLNVLDIV